MTAMKCELCNHNKFIKDDGLFRCEACDTGYSLEEARKLMKIDRGDEMDNLATRAKRFFDAGDLERAREYNERVLDIDADNSKALELNKDLNLAFHVRNAKLESEQSLLKLNQFLDRCSIANNITVPLLEMHRHEHSYYEMAQLARSAQDKSQLDTAWKQVLKYAEEGRISLSLLGSKHLSDADWVKHFAEMKKHYAPLVPILNQGIENANILTNAGLKLYGEPIDNDVRYSFSPKGSAAAGRLIFIYRNNVTAYIGGKHMRNFNYYLGNYYWNINEFSPDIIQKMKYEAQDPQQLIKKGVCISCHEKGLSWNKKQCNLCGWKNPWKK